MEGQSRLQGPGARRLTGIGTAAALAVALFVVVLVSGLPQEIRRTASSLGLVSGGLAVAASCLYRFRRATESRRRRSWVLFAMASVLAAGSNLSLILGRTGDRLSPGDVCLALCLVFGAIGVVTFPVARRRGTELSRMVLDGLVVGGSLMFIASVTLFPEILDTVGSRGPLVLLVPVIDTVIATLAGLLVIRSAPADRRTLSLGGLGFLGYAVSDFCYAYAIGGDGAYQFGTATDLGWIVGYALLAVAVRGSTIQAAPRLEPPPVETSPVLGTTVLFTLFLAAAGISLTTGRENFTPASAALWLVVLVAVITRQILLVIDNDSLRRVLERRVIERNRSLQQVTQQSDLLVNSVGDGIYGVDADGRVTFVNPAAARALGHPATALIGLDAHAGFHGHDPDGAPLPGEACYVTQAIQHGVATSSCDDTYVRADGGSIPVEVTATPLYDQGRTSGAVVVFRDITQRREVDRMKSEFVSMVSHELRTPLAAIRGSLGLMSGGAVGPLTPSAGRMVEIALLSSDRLARLINDMLDLERIESGAMSFELSDLSASSLVESTVGQVLVLAAQAQVRVEVGPVDGRVVADADRVVQTLLNLLGNAIKFSAPGSVVGICTRSTPGFVEFAISDRGRGIPTDKLETIFARFEQVDSSDAREKGGSGLGLAISRSIVDGLGGRIWASNNNGTGATFRFTLPAAPDQISFDEEGPPGQPPEEPQEEPLPGWDDRSPDPRSRQDERVPVTPGPVGLALRISRVSGSGPTWDQERP